MAINPLILKPKGIVMIIKCKSAATTGLIFCLCLHFGNLAHAQSIGDSIVGYLNSAQGARVGGGNSHHMASEALRIAGGEFVPADLGVDSPNTGDKVWGTLVTVISCNNGNWTDSTPANACLPGDVIQLGSAEFGPTSYPNRFTVVVAAVNQSGRPSSIFQQNFQGNRTVQKSGFDVTSLSSGWIRIYRPIQRIDRFNEWKFTVVNNSSSDLSFDVMVGIDTDSSFTLTSANTGGSYLVYSLTSDGTVPNLLLGNFTSFFVQTAKGNVITDSGDGPAISQLSK